MIDANQDPSLWITSTPSRGGKASKGGVMSASSDEQALVWLKDRLARTKDFLEREELRREIAIMEARRSGSERSSNCTRFTGAGLSASW